MNRKHIIIYISLFFTIQAFGQKNIEETYFSLSGNSVDDVSFTPDPAGKYQISGIGDGWIGFSGDDMEYRTEVIYQRDFFEDSLEYYRSNKLEEILHGRDISSVDFARETYVHSMLLQRGITPKPEDQQYYSEDFGILLLGSFNLPRSLYELSLQIIEKDEFERIQSMKEIKLTDNKISYPLLANSYYILNFKYEGKSKNDCPEKTVYISTNGIPEEVLPTGIIPQVEIDFTGKSKKCSVDFEWNDNLYTLTYKID